MDNIAQIMGVNYTLYESPDGRYGSKTNDTWTGIMKEVKDGVSTTKGNIFLFVL